MLKGPLRQYLKITHLVAIWSQSEDLITILSDLYGKIKIGKDVFDENFSTKHNFLIFSRFLLLPSHQVTFLLKPKLTLW